MERFVDKVVFITGAGGGLGREIARQFALEGAKVVITDIHEQKLAETEHAIVAEKAEALIFKQVLDVREISSIQAGVKAVKEAFGRIDILINNAGYLVYNHVSDYKLEDWDQLIDINLRGYFLTAQGCLELLKQSENGKIVNISSVAATNGMPGGTAYAASKGGINAMTRVLATDLAENKINVNAIAPGPIEGDFLHANSNESSLEVRINKTLFKRLGTYSDIAKPVLFLSSKDADWITGTILVADGGFTV